MCQKCGELAISITGSAEKNPAGVLQACLADDFRE
jgi:hypothetical protein